MTETAATPEPHDPHDARSDSSRTALLVIDVQNANTAEGHDREAVIGRIKDLIDQADQAGAPVIWVQHHAAGSPLERGTDGWQIVEQVRPAEGRTVVEKTYLDSFVETGLREELDRLGVGHLVITGAATDACIRSTTQRAQIEGYDVTLVADGHTTDEGPWELPLPDGSTASIGGAQMIAYTNFFVADTEYPGVTTRVVPAAEVSFAG